MTAKKPAKQKAAPEAEEKPKGRPSTFTQEIADEIIQRLAKGEPLEKICRDEHMPAVRTVNHWREGDAAFKADIARAREEGFDAIAAECLDIADDGRNDKYIDDNGMVRTDADVIQRSKLRIETRLKLLAKWDPKRYGDKIQQEHTGKDGGALQIVLSSVDADL
ncbi:hypothetical protein IP92_05762 [Pseudoduganella flava]|uniref:Terminase n=1 Tax=Pseudoduganella flava TaxID=871742 RepID=A0A562P9B7_9BURK|nr:terminase [Pseudoduganella flava]QGZ42706.1 terminase [Pseudoduganella flava]TWI41042.1 hypothetical protein IP92_05762 [Pseudoduganella flava]